MRPLYRAAVLLLIGGLTGHFSASDRARADLLSSFAGFDTAWETGVSGLVSSYDADTRNDLPVSGPLTGIALPAFGTGRVSYPGGIGSVPSPGGTVGRNFDEGAVGIRLVNDTLIVQLATALNPQTGYYHSGWSAWYGQGDVFLDLADTGGVRHYALLTTWARDPAGHPLSLNRGGFGNAQDFHVGGGPGGASLEGHLVRLSGDADVALTGGAGAYTASIAPVGLDIRAFAAAGADLGNAALVNQTVTDLGQPWYVQTWTLPRAALSGDPIFDIALHAIPSCGNDQIGARFAVPEPGPLALVLFGLLFVGVRCLAPGR